MLHSLFDAVRTARRIRPALSWKNTCRSPLARIRAARDVSLRIYCLGDVTLGLEGL